MAVSWASAGPGQRRLGTYLHGVFDARSLPPLVRRSPARAARAGSVGEVIGRYDIEPALERLAQAVRANVRIDDIYRIMGLQ